MWGSGETGSLSHGSVIDGRFEGFIRTHHGTYYVEPSERYLKGKKPSFHSIIYHEDDIGKYKITKYYYLFMLQGVVSLLTDS